MSNSGRSDPLGSSPASCRPPSDWALALSRLPEVRFHWNEPLARHTTFRVGGPVSCLARPTSFAGLQGLLRFTRSKGVPCFILGGGSNFLAPDDSWRGVAIQLHEVCGRIMPLDDGLEGKEAVRVYAGAGVRNTQWIRFCLQNGLSGMEFLAGIPGTVGGALFMNAGASGGSMTDPLVWLDCMDADGERLCIPRGCLSPRYRSLNFPPDWVVLGGCFRLRPLSKEELRRKLRKRMQERRKAQPLGLPSAGCVFKNPPGASAGALIDRAGLKGRRVGDAKISEKHANWIVNCGRAKAGDIVRLMETVAEEVSVKFGILLEPEIQVLDP